MIQHLHRLLRRLNFLCICCCLMLIYQMGQAQTSTIKGVVKAGDDGSGLPRVTIMEKGTANGVVSELDGSYEISVGPGATLVFTFVGYTTVEELVGNRTIIDITMQPALTELGEVVVIGYGAQVKESISGSVAQVDATKLATIPQAGIEQLLQGRAAGVMITQNSGQPGSAVSVRIRGVNSLQGSSEPLYIIDGIPVSGDSRNVGTSGRSIGNNAQGGGSTDVSPLAALNPNDIESVVVLKDASATAIYGSRGSNGVVLITTKKGKNARGKLTYSTYMGVQRPTNMIPVLDLPGYAELQNRIGEIYGLEEQIPFLNTELLGSGTNWQQEIFADAFMQNHQLAFSGGNENVNYFLSAGFLDQEGIVIGSGFNRASLRANINASITDKIRAGITLTASRTNEELSLNNSSQGIISLSLLNNPATAVYNPDGSFAGPVTAEEVAFGIRNPIAEALSISNDLRRDRILGNIYAEIDITDNLSFKTEIGGDFGNNLSDRFQPSFTYGIINRGINQLTVRRESTDFWIVKNLLTYQNNFNDRHDLTVLLGQEAQESTWQGIIAQDGDFVSNDVPILGTGDANDFIQQYRGSNALSSYFARAIYTLDNKYSVTASIRADGSSNFAEGNRWGYFPSISASWRLSEEGFWSESIPFTNVKLYGGYGEIGNQAIPAFAFGSRLTTVNTGIGTGFEFANFANPDLKWESSNQVNLGLSFSTLNDRLNATIEVYNKISKDFLFQFAATDFITGGNSPGAITAPWINIGRMGNRGIDLALEYSDVIGNKVTWNSSLTVSHYKNEVKELLGDLTLNGSVTLDGSNQNITITQPGQPIGLFYGFQVEGLFRTLDDIEGAPIQFGRPFEDALFATTWLGDVKFRDVNGDGVIDNDDRTVIGNPHPDFTFGFQNSFNYGNFELSVFMQGSVGNDVFNAIGRSLTAANRTFTNQSPTVLDFWSVQNPNSSSPRLARNDTPNINISDRYIEDGSYLRIQNLTFGYNVPTSVLRGASINALKIYWSVQNLATITGYSGYDPEIGSLNQNTTLMGIDNGRYPTPRIYTIGLNVEF